MNSPIQAELNRTKKLVFSLVGFVLLPLLGLVLVEAALRIAGYGYPTSFFKPARLGTEEVFVENPRFPLRFFPPEQARSPEPFVMKAQKGPGICRIFIFGESAALGDPRPAYGAGRCLEKLLRERYPEAKFEVICTAMTAINSHAILPIARECAGQDGDIWIIYMGNNEMVGPFGIASAGAPAPSVTYARFVSAVQKLRLGQLMVAGLRKLSNRPDGAANRGGMDMFLRNRVAPNDRRKGEVYHNFQRNLIDILHIARRSGVRVLLSTVAVNLKDCAPFASEGDAVGATKSEFEAALAEGANAERENKRAEAGRSYEQAVRLDPAHAEAQFRLGQWLLQETNAPLAKKHFEDARDLDALPFRTDSRINSIIRSATEGGQDGAVAAFDALHCLETNSPSGIPGEQFFYEHVHFNFDGNYRLGRAWAERVEELLPATIRSGKRMEWPSQAVCERRLGLSDWNRASVYEDVLRRLAQAPFTNQVNHAEQVQHLQKRLSEIQKRMGAESAKSARELYLEAIQAEPKDFRLHENFAEFLEATGDSELAAKERERVSQLLPNQSLYLARMKSGVQQGPAK